jgi:hypothetical protein
MKRRILLVAAVGGLFVGGAGVAVAGPYDSGPGPGPGSSGDHALYGLCMAYAHHADQAKEQSPVFNQYSPDEWADMCDGVTPGGR